tara:strand:+ start:17435 stop:18040 length:606 start_codon:yes stop_codon:yes gene_type:complete
MLETIIPIITAIVGVLGTLAAIKYKHKLAQKRLEDEHECPIGACISEDVLVIGKLREMLDETSADRISIYSFHNGGTFYSGKSMQKMSMSYEECDNGISSVMLNKQDIPVSACITTLRPLMLNGEFFCVDTNDYPEGLCKYHLKNDGVKSTYKYPIIDLHKNAIGILSVDFVKRKTRMDDEDHDSLKLLASQLPGYLSGHK